MLRLLVTVLALLLALPGLLVLWGAIGDGILGALGERPDDRKRP